MTDLTDWEWSVPGPEQEHVEVLMATHDGGYTEAKGFKRRGIWTITNGAHIVGPIVAWRPLPASPSEGECVYESRPQPYEDGGPGFQSAPWCLTHGHWKGYCPTPPKADIPGLVERLRDAAVCSDTQAFNLLHEAADALEAGEREIDELDQAGMSQAKQILALQLRCQELEKALERAEASLGKAWQRFMTHDFDDKQHGYIVQDWLDEAIRIIRAALKGGGE